MCSNPDETGPPGSNGFGIGVIRVIRGSQSRYSCAIVPSGLGRIGWQPGVETPGYFQSVPPGPSKADRMAVGSTIDPDDEPPDVT